MIVKKWVLNKCDENGNIITGYQEIFWSNQTSLKEAKQDFQVFNSMESWEEIDVSEKEVAMVDLICQKCGRILATGPETEKLSGECCDMPGIRAE